MTYIGVKIREEAYNCRFCSTLKEHLEACTLKAMSGTSAYAMGKAGKTATELHIKKSKLLVKHK